MIIYVRSEVVFGADIIAGFPTENDEMFQNTVDLIEDCNIIYIVSILLNNALVTSNGKLETLIWQTYSL